MEKFLNEIQSFVSSLEKTQMNTRQKALLFVGAGEQGSITKNKICEASSNAEECYNGSCTGSTNNRVCTNSDCWGQTGGGSGTGGTGGTGHIYGFPGF